MRPEKISLVKEVQDKVQDSGFLIVTDYRGLNMAKTDDLKQRLRGANARMQVIPNRMLRIASTPRLGERLTRDLTGPSAMVYGSGDVVQVAKVLKDFIKENNLPVIKVGAMGATILSSEDIQQLASLPPREFLLGQAVGTIAAPLTRLVGVMQQKVASLLYVLKAVQEKKQQAAA